ncbi:MAG: methyltransferase [Oleibacter sp.]|nr:methyltransferase [Thalassolituus sp.]
MAHWSARDLKLECFPIVPSHVSLPWDAADDYLLEQIDLLEESNPTDILILNDRYGALACALPSAHSWVDSFCGHQALSHNRQRNGLSFQPRLTHDQAFTLEGISHIVIRIPKDHDLLREQLSQVGQNYPDAEVWLAGMAKHVPVSLLNWLENNAEQYQQLPIQRKARLIKLAGLKKFIQPTAIAGYSYNKLKLNAVPGVFGRHQIDLGARVMLQYLPQDLQGRVCDLGCGNGILALSVAQHCLQTNTLVNVIATDDSELAVISAKDNALRHGFDIDVRHGHSLSEVSETLDWVLCNPPFHDGHKQLTNIADVMFKDATRALKQDGQLLVVANRHLPYFPMLKRLFSRVDLISDDKRFNIYQCQR